MSDVDFDLHGIVRVRLVDPQAADVAILRRQLGPLDGPAQGAADITVRFSDRLAVDRPLTYVGFPEAGYDGRSFYLLKGQRGASSRTHIPFEDVGVRRCDIVAERAAGSVPHLLAIVNLTALTREVLPLHASAFLLDGTGVLATGWSKGGKTETLLAFAAHGARYVGDEWVYLTVDGEMVGLPEPIRLWHWHLRQLPHIWSGLSRSSRARLALLDGAASQAERLAPALPAASSVLRRAAPVLRRQAFRQIAPHELFGAGGTAPRARLDALLLVTSHDRPDVVMRALTGDQVADRMRASLQEERSSFMASYRQFRFAFPDRCSDVVERAEELEAKLLTRVFAGRPAFEISHPYPFQVADLVQPVRKAVAQLTAGGPHSTAETGETP